MADTLELVHVSGGLISPAILADALSDAPRRDEFQPSQFGWGGHDPEPPAQFAETLEATFQLACEHYDSIAKNLDSLSLSELRDKWLRQLLRLLDFKETYQPKLKSQDGRESFDINFLGWEGDGAPPIHLVKGGLDDAPGRGRKSPHEELQHYLNNSPATWGIVANGRQLRLLRDFHHVFTKAFVGFDLDAIFETRDFAAFRALFRLCHRSRFELAADRAKIPLESLFDSSQAEGIQIGRQLQPQVRGAIEALAEGLFSPQLRQMLDDPKAARGLYHELLLVIYRILFLLFAEQRRMLPAEGLYAETYSVAALARLAERKTVEPNRCDLWEGLKVTFKMLSQGAPEIGVFPFNGQLFDLQRTPHLMAQSCENKFLLKAIEKLTHVRVENFQQRVNYAELGVEELGSVYETLLSYTLRLAHAPTEAEGFIVPTGAVYLASLSTERKDLGAHYTRPALVDFLLSVSLDKLIAERLAEAKQMASCEWQMVTGPYRDAFLNYANQRLSGPGGLATGTPVGQGIVSTHGEVPRRGEVWTGLATAAGGGVHSVERGRGLGTALYSGVHPGPAPGQRKPDGGGDADDPQRGLGLCHDAGSGSSPQRNLAAGQATSGPGAVAPETNGESRIANGGERMGNSESQMGDTTEHHSPFAIHHSPEQIEALWNSTPFAIRHSLFAQHSLLDIRVCDPACGSGAILVGAIDRLALALATVRADGDKPTEAALQEARRDVLAHCIYGVDKDAFAVELCKVALWIHCTVPKLPLSFLDHRIQHGDSLVGWPLLNVPSIIPRDAYSVPGSGGKDEEERQLRAFLKSAYEANELAIQGQGELGQVPPMPDIRTDFPAVMAEEERIPGDVEKKDAAFKGYMQSEAYRRFKAAADLWTAAFFWSHEVGASAPTTEHYRRALSGDFDAAQVKAAEELLEQFPAFHWPLRFPEIAARGGFDCFVGNPPWEQVKINEQEWFRPHDPNIAALPSAPRRAAIAALQQSNPALWRKWRLAQRAYDRLAEYMRNCGRFSPSEHEPNTYLLFTDTVADALRPNGRAGIIVKTALGTDKSATGVFHRLLRNDQIEEFHDHVNGGPTGSTPIFIDVAAVERFVVLGLRGAEAKANKARGFQASILNWSVEEARSRPRQHFTFEILKTLNPKTATLTSFRRGEEFEVALDIHRRTLQPGAKLALLDFDKGGSNPWGLKYATLFHSSGDQELFLRREDLERDGWELGRDMIFRRKRRLQPDAGHLRLFDQPNEIEEALPLYEGQLANRYNHRAKTYAGYKGENKFGMKPGLPEATEDQLANPQFEIEPRYWMQRCHADERFRQFGEAPVIGMRDVARPWNDQRCARCCLLPRWPATDTLPIMSVVRDYTLAFIGVFNSTTFDFLVRGHMPGAHVRLVWMLSQIPAPLPGTLDKRVAEQAAKLSLTSHSVARLFNREPHPWNPEERYALDVEIDALVAHAYGLTRAQYEVVLDSFEVLARIEIGKHGRYKFKEDCLAAYRRE